MFVELKKSLFNHKNLQSINQEEEGFFKLSAEAYKRQHLMIHGVIESSNLLEKQIYRVQQSYTPVNERHARIFLCTEAK